MKHFGPCAVLMYMNDILTHVTCCVKMLAGDTTCYSAISDFSVIAFQHEMVN